MMGPWRQSFRSWSWRHGWRRWGRMAELAPSWPRSWSKCRPRSGPSSRRRTMTRRTRPSCVSSRSGRRSRAQMLRRTGPRSRRRSRRTAAARRGATWRRMSSESRDSYKNWKSRRRRLRRRCRPCRKSWSSSAQRRGSSSKRRTTTRRTRPSSARKMCWRSSRAWGRRTQRSLRGRSGRRLERLWHGLTRSSPWRAAASLRSSSPAAAQPPTSSGEPQARGSRPPRSWSWRSWRGGTARLAASGMR
mmetsp:Transcript_92731/g.225166  ORF Transcript_92731/g.225166 Transcript_92731/m.225166 type:complete len:246 (+) Transcript_92731:570-1307(+)